MSRGSHEVLEWVDRRLDAMLARPRAWGGGEAVETQVLLLLQFRALLARPGASKVATHALESYFEYLERSFPAAPHLPLHQIVGDDPTCEKLAFQLQKVVTTFRAMYEPENPFEHHRLAIRLEYRDGCIPRTSSVTGYFEEFRRATRATARRPGASKGRVARDIEQATDFELIDVRVVPKNGAPAQAWILMGNGPGQVDFVANEAVQEALIGMATLAEWAGGTEAVERLGIDSAARRETLALQTLRVLPRGDVSQVEVGGLMLGRTEPVVYRPNLEGRVMEAVGTTKPAEPFDKEGEIRAFDKDRGELTLGKQPGVRCFVRPELVPNVLAVGEVATVRGRLFTPTIGKPFVIVESPIEGPAVEADSDGELEVE